MFGEGSSPKSEHEWVTARSVLATPQFVLMATNIAGLTTNPGRRSDLDSARHSGESRNPERMSVDMRGVSCPLIGRNVVRKKDKGETTGFRHAPE